MPNEDWFEIPLEKLLPWNPFDHVVWHLDVTEPITIEEVEEAVSEECIRPEPIEHRKFFEDPSPCARKDHIARIAWFVMHGWDDPIDIDTGSPEFGFCADWPIEDGNHRLAAAFFRRENTIKAFVWGTDAEELFGLTFPEK